MMWLVTVITVHAAQVHLILGLGIRPLGYLLQVAFPDSPDRPGTEMAKGNTVGSLH